MRVLPDCRCRHVGQVEGVSCALQAVLRALLHCVASIMQLSLDLLSRHLVLFPRFRSGLLFIPHVSVFCLLSFAFVIYEWILLFMSSGAGNERRDYITK